MAGKVRNRDSSSLYLDTAMRILEFLKHFPDYRFTREQYAYARYLEQQGLCFLVDFGFANAEDLAWYHLEREHQMHLDHKRFILGHA